MMFKSRQVNLDPEPWECPCEGRHEGVALCNECYRRPRPEFEPTRDPEPWMCHDLPNHGPFEAPTCDRCYWAPRREQFDTPVNRVLVLFRRDAEHNGIDSALGYDWPTNSVASTPGEIDHARRVLTRLANWQVTS